MCLFPTERARQAKLLLWDAIASLKGPFCMIEFNHVFLLFALSYLSPQDSHHGGWSLLYRPRLFSGDRHVWRRHGHLGRRESGDFLQGQSHYWWYHSASHNFCCLHFTYAHRWYALLILSSRVFALKIDIFKQYHIHNCCFLKLL